MKKIKYLILLMLCLLTITSCKNNDDECKHKNTTWIIDVEATCTIKGSKHEECTDCGKNLNEETIDAHHTFVNNVCSICGKNNSEYDFIFNGKYVYFGEYPQTLKFDYVIITSTIPDENGYYLGSDGERYAKVVATPDSYETMYFNNKTTINSGTTYYFKVEPIKWQILESSNGTYKLVTDLIIDNQVYYSSTSTRTIDGKTIYANNYEYSDIRKWLNEEFYNQAFTTELQIYINTTLVDNSVSSTGCDVNSYICNDTYDKVYLLSYSDVTNTSYGYTNSESREKQLTDYAKAKGCCMDTYEYCYNNGYYWLRSPYNTTDVGTSIITSGGSFFFNYWVINNIVGVAPAITITNSQNCLEHVESDWIIEKKSTCTITGSKYKECIKCGKILERVEYENIVHNYNEKVISPTCTEQGYTVYECKDCGHTYNDNYVDALGHTIDSGTCTRCHLLLGVPELDTTKEITVKFWHANGQALQEVIGMIIENFEELYPNIKVEQSSLGDYTTLRDTITNGIAADELPTIAQTYPDHVATYLKGDVLRELDLYIESTNEITLSNGLKDIIGLTKADRNDYIDGFYAEGTIYDIAGTMYSLPFNKSTEVLYYNKTIFDKYGWSVPKTWDDVVTISEAFKETIEYKTLVSADKKVSGLSYDREDNLFITLTKQWGGEYTKFNASGKGEYAFTNNAKSKEAISWYKEQFDDGNLVTTTHFGTDYSSDAFKAGQCIMTIALSAGASYNSPSDGSFEVGVAAYPQKDLSNPQVIQQSTNVSLFKCADEQEELAGWLFMKYLTNYESALLWCTNTSYFPIRKSVLNSDEYQEHISGKIVDGQGNITYKPTLQNLAQKVGLEQQDWFYTNVAFYGSSRARDEVELVVQQILYGKVSVDTAYSNAENTLLYG